jgi:hypothetical protein
MIVAALLSSAQLAFTPWRPDRAPLAVPLSCDVGLDVQSGGLAHGVLPTVFLISIPLCHRAVNAECCVVQCTVNPDGMAAAPVRANGSHMSEFFTTEALSALLQVIMIDLVLAGDNAIVIGLAAAGLPKSLTQNAATGCFRGVCLALPARETAEIGPVWT